MRVEIGLDDTDSADGMCTTYIAHRLVERLLKTGAAEASDYPRLIRLNPNIPWKTRGNGAVTIPVRTRDPNTAFQEACRAVEEYSEAGRGAADPGVVVSTLEQIPKDIKQFAEKALSEVVTRREAVQLMKKYNMQFRGWGTQRGLIGALAAIGSRLEKEDRTYELLAFRSQENWRVKKRKVDPISVREMSLKTQPRTFNSFDEEKERVMITPRGPDPVLLGIRGEDPDALLEAYSIVDIDEAVDGHMIFKSNQGTGVHLKPELNPAELKAYRAGHLKCTVSKKPWIERGGHVYFEAENGGHTVTCAAYEPTGGFRKTVLNLIPGDTVEIGGSIRKKSRKHGAAINLEYLRVLELAKDISVSNPLCRRCGRRMESQGRGQPFRCSACGFEDPSAEKIRAEQPRAVQKNLYLPPPRAQRHLTKPLQRYQANNRKPMKLIDGWFEPTASPPLKQAKT